MNKLSVDKLKEKMSQIGLVRYPGPTHKLNILQQSSLTNSTKTNDRQVIILRKPQNILPQPKDIQKNNILLTNTARKGSKKSTTKETKGNPQPIAVARRNARERNRVKQVNNGFANLRQRIPNFIAQAFESNNGRGGTKKLSKVETLRMAVEYIRSLEDILELDVSCIQESISDISYSSLTLSNTPTSDQNNSKSSTAPYNFAMSPSEDDDDMSSISTPPPQQFIRINPSNNTYEIIPSGLYENAENLDPMSVNSHIISDTSIIDPHNIEFGHQDLSYLNIHSMQTTGSLSPGMYSEGSLSPNMEKQQIKDKSNCFIRVSNGGTRLSPNFNVHIKTEINDLPVTSIKTENEHSDLEKQKPVDLINWWDEESQTTTRS